MTDDYPRELSLLIAGEWLPAGHRATRAVLNPATGETLAQLPLADTADLDRALDAAQSAFEHWRHSAIDERSRVLKAAAGLLRGRVDALARHATLEQGKPLADAGGEVLGSAALLDFYAVECRRLPGRELPRPPGRRASVTCEPVGPVAAFAPWNFPLHNPARKLAPAIAAGCSVILKPAEETPGSALHIARALVDAGLPPGVVQIVFGVPDEVSRHLLASPVIRKLSFTGSTTVGRHLLSLAARQPLRTTMELGGHAPVLVFADADVEAVAERLARTKFRNAGQVCISPTRFLIQRPVYERFAARFVAEASRVVVGNGLQAGVQMGPLAHARRVEAIGGLVDDARRHGARLLLGGHRLEQLAGNFYAPTVLADVPRSARAMNEEPFGPLALLMPFDGVEDALAEANRLPYGLAAYAWTSSASTAKRVAAALESGMVGLNTTSISGADTPFGGIKHSGHGLEDGAEGLAAYFVTKVIHEELASTASGWPRGTPLMRLQLPG